MAYNTSIHSTTGYSPFFLMYGKEAHLPVDIVYGTQPSVLSTVDTYVQRCRKLLEESFDRVRVHLSAGHQKQKQIYDKRIHGDPYKVGDTVWLLDSVVDKGQSRKLHHPWKGPYYVVKKIAECDYQIKSVTDECEQIVHFNRLKLCKPGTHFHENLSADIQSQSPSTSPDSTLFKTTPGAVGNSLELVDWDITCSHRPSRTVRLLTRFDDFLAH